MSICYILHIGNPQLKLIYLVLILQISILFNHCSIQVVFGTMHTIISSLR